MEKSIKIPRSWLGRALVIKWKDKSSDWHYFRLEKITDNVICLTGMCNESGDPHVGDWVSANVDEIKSIRLR